jgi:hypothetical protein
MFCHLFYQTSNTQNLLARSPIMPNILYDKVTPKSERGVFNEVETP